MTNDLKDLFETRPPPIVSILCSRCSEPLPILGFNIKSDLKMSAVIDPQVHSHKAVPVEAEAEAESKVDYCTLHRRGTFEDDDGELHESHECPLCNATCDGDSPCLVIIG